MADNPYQPFITDRRSAALPSTPIQMTHPVDTSSVGRAIEGLGAAISGLGAKDQAETDHIQATEAITASVQKMDDIWGAYSEKTGRDAFDSFADTRNQLNQVLKDAQAAAPNTRQKAAITSSLGHSLTIFDANIMRHRIGEKKSWQDTTSQNAIAEFGKQAIASSDAGYEARFDLFMKSARDEAVNLGRNRGLDAEAAASQANATVGKLINEAVQYQVNRGDLSRANSIFQRYKPNMDAGSIVHAEGYLSGKNMDVKVEQMLNQKFPLTSSNPVEAQRAAAQAAQPASKPIQDRLGNIDEPRMVNTVKINPETGEVEQEAAKPNGSGNAVLPSKPSQYDSIIDDAAKTSGVNADVMKRIMHIESGGKADNKTDSYHGLFQLSLTEFKKNGGKGNIYDPTENANAAARKLAKEIDEFKVANGREPTATDIYLQHQQGMGGAAAHRSNPDKLAWENMYSTAEGQDKGKYWAKRAIWGNIPDSKEASPTFNKKMFPGGVETVTSQQFMDGWRSKVEGNTGSTSTEATPAANATTTNYGLPPIKEALQWAYDASGGDVVLREKLQGAIADRYRAYDQEKADARASLTRKVDNVVTELETNGTQSEYLAENDFTSVYGADEGAIKYEGYLNAKKAARVSNELKSAPITEHEALLQSIRPEAGDPLFADKMDALNKARILSNKAKKSALADSAGFAVSTSETVKNDLEAALKGGPEDAQKYISDLREEQRRLGIPAGEWRILPKDITQRIADTIADTKDKTPGQVLAFVTSQRAKWGDNWDDIVREMKGKLPDALYVASQEGVNPSAAATIISQSDIKINDILKASSVSVKDLKTEMADKFSDFSQSMADTSSGREEAATIYDQTLKLAATYAAQGKDASSAVTQAYDQVVGGRYEFISNRGWYQWSAAAAPRVRVPKKYSGAITDDSLSGIRNRIFNHDPAVHMEDDSVKVPPMADKSEIERDSYFATLPNDGGVAVFWRNKLLLKQDGRPQIFTWDKIMSLDSEPSAAEREHAVYLSKLKERQRIFNETKAIYY